MYTIINQELKEDWEKIKQESVISFLTYKERSNFILECNDKKYIYHDFNERRNDVNALIN